MTVEATEGIRVVRQLLRGWRKKSLSPVRVETEARLRGPRDSDAPRRLFERCVTRKVDRVAFQMVVKLVSDVVVAQAAENAPFLGELEAVNQEESHPPLRNCLVRQQFRSLQGPAEIGVPVLVDRLPLEIG